MIVKSVEKIVEIIILSTLRYSNAILSVYNKVLIFRTTMISSKITFPNSPQSNTFLNGAINIFVLLHCDKIFLQDERWDAGVYSKYAHFWFIAKNNDDFGVSNQNKKVSKNCNFYLIISPPLKGIGTRPNEPENLATLITHLWRI